MSGYRDDKRLTGLDEHTVGWHSARYGIGMLAIALGILVNDGPPIISIIVAAIGVPLFIYGMRNP